MGAGVDTRIEGVQTMSDCVYFASKDLPGCPEPLSTQLRVKMNRQAAADNVSPIILCMLASCRMIV
jgi:hypothetical protein